MCALACDTSADRSVNVCIRVCVSAIGDCHDEAAAANDDQDEDDDATTTTTTAARDMAMATTRIIRCSCSGGKIGTSSRTAADCWPADGLARTVCGAVAAACRAPVTAVVVVVGGGARASSRGAVVPQCGHR